RAAVPARPQRRPRGGHRDAPGHPDRHTEVEERPVMNIEDLIREANPVRASDVAAGDSARAQRTLERILGQPGAADRGRRSGRGRKRTMLTVGLAFTAAGAMVAVLLSA